MAFHFNPQAAVAAGLSAEPTCFRMRRLAKERIPIAATGVLQFLKVIQPQDVRAPHLCA